MLIEKTDRTSMHLALFSSSSNCHKKILQEKIQQLTNEINQLKKENKTDVFYFH